MTNKTYITFDQIDNTARTDATYTTTTNMAFCDLSSIKTSTQMASNQADYATFEENFTLLDGTFFFLPYYAEDLSYPFWSSHMSDSNGDFAVNPTITTILGTPHSSAGISIYFKKELPLKVKVTFYSNSDNIISQKEYDVTSAIFSTTERVLDYKKVVIEFTKTKPYRFVKLYYIDYGRSITFGEDVLKEATLIRECDPISNKIPISTLDFKFCDKTDDYNLANQEGLSKILQKNQKIKLYREKDGVTESNGNFYLTEYSVENNVVSMKTNDVIGILENSEFRGKIYTGEYFRDVLSEIQADAGIVAEIIADYELGLMPVYGLIRKQSCRNALRDLCFMFGAYLVCRNGAYIVEFQSKTVQSTIGRDRKFSTATVKNDSVTKVSVKYKKYVLNTATVKILDGHFTAGEHTLTFTSPVANLTTSAGVIMTYATYYCTLYLATESDIIISGNKYDEQEVIVSYSDQYAPDGENANEVIISAGVMDNASAMQRAKEIYDYYQMGLTITTRFVNDTEEVGNYAMIANSDANYSDFIAGIESISTDLIGGWITTATARGYFQQFTDDVYCGEFYCGEDGVL